MKIKKVLAIIFALLADVIVTVNPFIFKMLEVYTIRNLDPFPRGIYFYAVEIVFCGLLCACTYLFTQIGKNKTVIWISAISAIACFANLAAQYNFGVGGSFAMRLSLTSSVFFVVFTLILLFSRKKAEN